MNKCIAERRLLYSLKNSDKANEFVIRIGEPYLLNEGDVDFPIHEGAAGCSFEFEGFPEEINEEVHGADLLQALQFAVDVEPILKNKSKKYNIYYPTGEPYFDDESNT